MHDKIKVLTDNIADYCVPGGALSYLGMLDNLSKDKKALLNDELFTHEKFGVWEKLDGEWVRDSQRYDSWYFWADRHSIPKKRLETTRVVLLGESVARGYLFDPVINLTKIMESHFEQSANEIEIIDLARIDMTALGLREAIKAVEVFEPDYLICFAGNNWHQMEMLSRADLVILSDIFKTAGLSAVREYIKDSIMHPEIDKILTSFSGLRESCKLIFVIPGFNETGWVHDKTCPKSMLWEDQNDCDFNAVFGLPVRHTPRCFSFIRIYLKEYFNKHNIDFIDVTDVLLHASPQEPIGARYYIDYCHLNFDGLSLIATEISKRINLNLIEKADFSSNNTFDLGVYNRDFAASYFLAAIHNAHYGQPMKTIMRLLEQSVSYAPEVKELFKNFILLSTSSQEGKPDWITRSYEQCVNFSAVIRKYFMLRRSNHESAMYNPLLIGAMTTILGEDHVIREKLLFPINLLRGRYWCETFGANYNYDLRSKKAYQESLFPDSIFRLFLVKGVYQLNLCCRRSIPSDFPLKIYVEDICVFEDSVSNKWTDMAIEFKHSNDADCMIRIHWGEVTPSFIEQKNQFLEHLSQGMVPDLFVKYGDIYLCEINKQK